MTIELSHQERDLIIEIFSEHLKDLLFEIHRTSTYQYKKDLKAKQMVIESLLERIKDLSMAA